MSNMPFKKNRPPKPFTTPIVICPACEHGIDVHRPTRICGVGDEYGRLCRCLWTPNDIAGVILDARHAKIVELQWVIAAGIEAFRLTKEYVNVPDENGDVLLPDIAGWSHFDWTETATKLLNDNKTQPGAASI